MYVLACLARTSEQINPSSYTSEEINPSQSYLDIYSALFTRCDAEEDWRCEALWSANSGSANSYLPGGDVRFGETSSLQV
jgi:hypothetical protein